MKEKSLKTYSELVSLSTFKERFEYLNLHGKVGEETFGFDRYFNQKFYTSKEWRDFRNRIIARDLGCDLAHKDHPIHGRIYVHHMNPIGISDISNATDLLLNPEYAVSVSSETHEAIHYGDYSKIDHEVKERKPNDTCPWR